MQKDIIKKIDLLVEMSDTSNHFESLEEELKILELDIAKQKDAVNELTKSMVDTKYMKASDRLIDENIKISLENKLASYEHQKQDLKKKIEKISKEEEEHHQRIIELEEEVETSKKFLESLELKLKTIGSKDKSVYSFYEELLDTVSNEIKSNEKKLNDMNKVQEEVQKQLESYGEIRSNLEEKIEKDSEKLEETKTVLMNPKSYVDEAERSKDEEQIKVLNSSIEDLEKRRLEILTDPSYIAQEARELLINDDRTSTVSKVKELVNIVNKRPYMNVRYEELDELLEASITKRDEFASEIEAKKYDGTDSDILGKRVEFLKNRQGKKQKEQEELEKRILEMDTTLVKELMASIHDAKEKRNQLKDDIEEYKKVMEENNDYKTPKKKASLNAAFHRKCEELEQVNQLVASYEKDLENIISTSKKLEETELSFIKEELKKIEKEIVSIEKAKLLNNYPKDILAMEKDKSELKKLSDEVDNINHRKKYQKMPVELLDEIEMSLSSVDYEEKEEKEEEILPNYDFRIDSLEEDFEEEQVQEEKTLEEEIVPPEVPVIEETPQDIEEEESIFDLIEPPSLEEEKEEVSFPPRKTIEEETPSNLWKVIKVEPLEEESSEEEFMVNDFEDTNYISFNDLLEGGEENASKA